MSKSILPLDCSIQACGLPFTVTDTLKDTTFQPGSQGLLSYVMGPDYNNPNIIFQQVVTTRRGKGGKPRLNVNMVLSPIFRVPGVEFDAMFPKAGDRKHFIEIDVDKDTTQKVIGQNNPIDNGYLAWLLAKCLFIRELDKAVYPPDHQIMSSLELGGGGGKQVYVWPKDKLSKLKQFTGNIERWFNDGAIDQILESYSGEPDKAAMLTQMHFIESALLIPRIEYQRKVIGVMLDALNYVSKFINDKNNKVKDKTEVNRSLKQSRKMVKAQRTILDTTIKARLGIIAKNRQFLNV